MPHVPPTAPLLPGQLCGLQLLGLYVAVCVEEWRKQQDAAAAGRSHGAEVAVPPVLLDHPGEGDASVGGPDVGDEPQDALQPRQ